jgi:hypothetical protein
MDYCRDWYAADMDRSEIGPYLGGLRATFTVVTQGRTAALANTTDPTQNCSG